MKRWQRMLLAYVVVAALSCALVFAIIFALAFTICRKPIDNTDHLRWLGVGAMCVVLLGATQIIAIRDRILGR